MITIEKVARALAKRHYEHRFGTEDKHHIQMNVDGNWGIFADDARAAVEALKDPGEAAMNAGLRDYLDQEKSGFTRVPWNGRRMFGVMMNAILIEKPE